MELTTIQLIAANSTEHSATLLIDAHSMKVEELRNVSALISGVTLELADKLKCEFVHKRHGSGKNGQHVKFVETLMDMDVQNAFPNVAEGDQIVLINWGKIGSGNKWEISRLVQICMRRERVLMECLSEFLNSFDSMAENADARTFSMMSALPEFAELISALGAEMQVDSVLFPLERKSRRFQLLSELVTEYAKPDSVMNSVSYGACEKHEEEVKVSDKSAARSAPAAVGVRRSNSRKNHHNHNHNHAPQRTARSQPNSPVDVDEKMPVMNFRSLQLDVQFDFEEDFCLDDMDFSGASSSSNSRRRQDRRRRRKEQRRLAHAHDFHFEDLDDADLKYEDLVQLENVPVGVDKKLLDCFPVQVLKSADIERLHGQDAQTCRICLADFCVGDQLMRLPCLHGYHKLCISKWLQNNNKCPQDMLAVDGHLSME